MPIEYKAIVGYGYHVDRERLSRLSDEEFEDFVDSGYTICINSWQCSDDYFFGSIENVVEEGEIQEAPTFLPSNILLMNEEFQRFFNEPEAKPKTYVMLVVS